MKHRCGLTDGKNKAPKSIKKGKKLNFTETKIPRGKSGGFFKIIFNFLRAKQ
jgi:hypothetical protein